MCAPRFVCVYVDDDDDASNRLFHISHMHTQSHQYKSQRNFMHSTNRMEWNENSFSSSNNEWLTVHFEIVGQSGIFPLFSLRTREFGYDRDHS